MFKLWIIAFFMMWTPSFSEHEKATFDEIMNTIVMMTDKVKELDEIYHWTNETFEPMRITKGLFDDAATYASLAISTAQFAYQIKKDMDDAKEAEKQRIIEDQRFQTLKEQNIELMGKIDAVKNAVEQAANKISDAIMHQTFNMEVKLPLDKLMDSYAIMMKGMLPEDYLDFNTSCKALGHTPKDIISFMFIRHCIASNLLHQHDWTLFLDADVAVINPSRLIDTFVQENEKIADLVFYDRFYNSEIAAGSYLAKNSNYSKEFLMKFANAEFSLPRSFHGTDNGALHWLFVQEFFMNQTSELDLNDCHKIWEKSKDFNDVFVYEVCCRLIMGETRIFHDPAGKGSIKLIPKGEAWMRDAWLTNSIWSKDSDFLLHGWKHSTEIQMIKEGSSCKQIGQWYRTIANPSFDLAACSNGTIQWQWWSKFMVSKHEVQDILMKKRLETQKEFYKLLALIPKYLK